MSWGTAGNSGDYKCPVCEVGAFAGPGTYEICEKCGWENDPEQLDNPNLKGGANQMSLNEAREAWEERADADSDSDDGSDNESDDLDDEGDDQEYESLL